MKGVNVYPAQIRNVVVSFAPRTTGQMRMCWTVRAIWCGHCR